jgi:dolichol-phosphate mannosyltransferase
MTPIYNDVIVWLPTFNEEMNVVKMITDISALGFQVRVTDGGSTDNTVALAQSAGVDVHLRPGKHKGYGIKCAMEESLKAGYKKLIYIDCDQTYPVAKLQELYTMAETSDIVVGARDFSKIVFINRMANYFFTGLINLFFHARLSDTQSGMRIIQLDKFVGNIKSDEFDLETELTCFALKSGLKMRELPIDYYKRVGKSKTSVWQAILIIRRIFICRFVG